MIFKDNEGRLYRDIDQKGGGWIGYYPKDNPSNKNQRSKHHFVRELSGEHSDLTGIYGLAEPGRIEHDAAISAIFLALNIRTHAVVSVIELKEIIDELGNKVSIDEARSRNLIPDDYDDPVIEIRAFGTKARIGEVDNQLLVKDAMALVEQERGTKITASDYLQWFCKTLGDNVGKMHEAGYAHGFLNEMNITLDCRIVDLDSVVNKVGLSFLQKREWRVRALDDQGQAIDALERLKRGLLRFAANSDVESEKNEVTNIQSINVGKIFESFYKNELKK